MTTDIAGNPRRRATDIDPAISRAADDGYAAALATHDRARGQLDSLLVRHITAQQQAAATTAGITQAQEALDHARHLAADAAATLSAIEHDITTTTDLIDRTSVDLDSAFTHLLAKNPQSPYVCRCFTLDEAHQAHPGAPPRTPASHTTAGYSGWGGARVSGPVSGGVV